MSLGTGSVLDNIVHPRLHESLRRFYPAQVTIQRPTYTLRPNGEQVATWADVLCDLRGNLAQRHATERRDGVMTRVPIGMALNLAGHYPDITVTDRAMVDGAIHNIAAVIHDSLSGSTRLDLEDVTH